MNPEAASDLIIVGLGNPGPEYAATRHNLGFRCVEELGRRLGVSVDRRRWRSHVGSASIGGRPVWLVLPQTFMNLSGRAVADAMRDLGVPPAQVWVVHDELDLPLCRLRIRQGGSAAGNNGIRSIIGALGRPDFWRFRVGVGKPPSAPRGVDHVLGRFGRAEAERAGAVVDGLVSALELAIREGMERAMATYNRAGSLGCDELP